MAALTLRLPPDLHRLVKIAAAAANLPAHTWMLRQIEAGVLRAGARDKRGAVAAELSKRDGGSDG